MNKIFLKFSGFFSKNKIKFLVGFTIIESVVAVAIISFSVIGPLSVS
jgi:prepilin-type N-terminal cleavage/methylation domain-containing protein